MHTIVVEVMPKAELLDPQGKAVAGALLRAGSRFSGVRVGKRFELSFDGAADDAALAEARNLAETLLSNSVIEDVVSVHPADSAPDSAADSAPGSAADSAPGSAADSAADSAPGSAADSAPGSAADSAADSAPAPAGRHTGGAAGDHPATAGS